ncbi:MAG: SIS domain-containing protein [Acidimicrobiales bacterium]
MEELAWGSAGQQARQVPVGRSEGEARLGSVMAREMAEQPERLAALLARRSSLVHGVRKLVDRPVIGTVLVARGSSDNAATCGAYMLEMATGRPVASTSPSIHTLYRASVDFSGYLVIAVSQSGQTPEITEVVDRARARGAKAIAVTNDEESPLASAAELVVTLGAGQELAVPATKTVSAELVAFAMIAQALGEIGFSDEVAEALPAQVAELLGDPGPAEALSEWLVGTDRWATVARGLLYGAAAEVALKVEETTSVFSTAFSAADLRHGPIAAASGGLPVLAMVHPGPASADVLGIADELRQRGARVRLAGPVAGSDLPWPLSSEVVAPVLAVVRGQQLALGLARRLGHDPDSPPGLSKVTST